MQASSDVFFANAGASASFRREVATGASRERHAKAPHQRAEGSKITHDKFVPLRGDPRKGLVRRADARGTARPNLATVEDGTRLGTVEFRRGGDATTERIGTRSLAPSKSLLPPPSRVIQGRDGLRGRLVALLQQSRSAYHARLRS